MKQALKRLNRMLVKWSLAFKPFGFLYFYSLFFMDRIITFFYCNLKFTTAKSAGCDVGPLADQDVLDLVTIAFNNPEVIECQIKFLRKNLSDQHNFTVADNSQTAELAQSIQKICQQYGVGYIRLPKNPYSGSFPSWSHGLALNWIYKNFLHPRGARYFGFLDHDIFPVERVSVLAALHQVQCYGSVQSRRSVWWLWPGFCFFRAQVFKNHSVNFSTAAVFSGFTAVPVDTGGGNWKKIYSKMPPAAVRRAVHRYSFLKDSPEGQPYSDLIDLDALVRDYDTSRLGEDDRFIEFIDGWLHIRKMGYSKEVDVKLKLKVLLSFFV